MLGHVTTLSHMLKSCLPRHETEHYVMQLDSELAVQTRTKSCSIVKTSVRGAVYTPVHFLTNAAVECHSVPPLSRPERSVMQDAAGVSEAV